MKFKSSAVDLTTFLAPRILSEGLFLYLEGKKGTKLFRLFVNCSGLKKAKLEKGQILSFLF